MLSSLCRCFSVAAISYGCIGRSNSSARTARASGLAGWACFGIFIPDNEYSFTSISANVSLCKDGVRRAGGPSGLIEPVERVKGGHRGVGVGADMGARSPKRGEGGSRDAGMAAHADPDHRDLGHIGCAVEALVAD